MALFSNGVLTKKGQALIAKSEATGAGIHITKARTGSGLHTDTSVSTLEKQTALLEPKQEFGISDLSTIPGNDGVAVITVVIHNHDLPETYLLNELGIYAEDPDEGEILYSLIVSSAGTTYIPADSSTGGLSSITERVYIEVTNAEKTVVETSGAVASATDFQALRILVTALNKNLVGGTAGEMLVKSGDGNYDYSWMPSNTITKPFAEFPAEGRSDALYIDSESSEFYIWKLLSTGKNGYFKLPIGSEASATLQKQITENSKNITSLMARVATLEGKFDDIIVRVPVGGWKATKDGDIDIYTNEIAITGMTADFDGTVFPYVLSTGASSVLKEMEAIGLYFSKGITDSANGKVVLTCYKKCPKVDFGIEIQGIKEVTT